MTFAPLRRASSALAAALLVCAAAHADRIFLTNGTTIEGDVIRDTLQGVVYKAKSKAGEQTQDADGVLRIEFTKLPKLLETAEESVGDNNLADAAEDFESYADGVLSGEIKKDKPDWAPGHALRRAIEVNQSIASQESLGKVVVLADKLIEKLPDSRQAAFAFAAKAEALRELGKQEDAAAAAAGFKQFVETKGLSQAYKLEASLLEALLNPALRGAKRRERVVEIAGQAGTQYPIVRSRAKVAEAETYIEGETKDFAKALKIYQEVVKDPKADDLTLAGAYTGLGDCLFQQGAEQLKAGAPEAPATLKECVFAYMRVAVVYKDQARFVPKAMYYAGRAFDLMGEDQRPNARTMYGRLIAQFPGSNWAQEARNQRR
ncbi:MAG: tetratricopeptide repeat protein [Planctomycetes bacterium]|nr:tetratricopeptide repeat protein [Planctomycetota bacterium]